jgi:hypothetical protein
MNGKTPQPQRLEQLTANQLIDAAVVLSLKQHKTQREFLESCRRSWQEHARYF